MAGTQTKGALFDALAGVAKALGSGRRAEIIDVLSQGERSVEEVAGEIGQSVANTSHQLQQLLRAGLVRTRREGTRIHYSLAGPRVGELWAAVRDVAAEHVEALDQLATAYLGDRSRLETITREELFKRLRTRNVVVLDVRPELEFAAGHVAGAVSVPVKELTRRLREVPKDRTIVAYCRGPYCVLAVEAVALLRKKGFRAVRLEEGILDWAAHGLRVEASTSK